MRIKTIVIYDNGIEKSYLSPELPKEYTFEDCVSELNRVIQPSYKSTDKTGYVQIETDNSKVTINLGKTSSIEFEEVN